MSEAYRFDDGMPDEWDGPVVDDDAQAAALVGARAGEVFIDVTDLDGAESTLRLTVEQASHLEGALSEAISAAAVQAAADELSRQMDAWPTEQITKEMEKE